MFLRCRDLLTLLLSMAAVSVFAQSNISKTGMETMKIKLTSSAFQEGGMIPAQYTGDGINISPPLAWDAVPAGTESLALICDDPDAPGKTWVHWVIFNIPPTIQALPEKIPAKDHLENGAVQGNNDFKKIGYGGPCPPGGTHRYFFKLYALNSKLVLLGSPTKDELLSAMEGHILAEGQLMGKYSKSR